MTEDGFRPTELNPRNGAGLVTMVRGLEPRIPIQLLLDALVAGVEVDWRPAKLESSLLSRFDERRNGGTWHVVPCAVPPESGIRIVAEPGTLRVAAENEAHDIEATIGPGTSGSFVRATFQRDRTAVGPSAAPLATAVWRYLDEHYALGVGPLAHATDTRR